MQQQGTWNVTVNAAIAAGANTIGDVTVSGAALTSLQLTDDVVHSGDAVVSKYALIGAVLDDTAPGAVTENQAQSLRMSTRRALLVEGVASGTAVNTSAAQSGTWNVTVNAAIAAGDNNIGNVDVVTLPALPAGANNIGDVDVLTIAAGDNNIGNVDIVTMPNVTLAAGTNTNEVVGDAAHDAAIAGNPVRIGGRALTADYTAVVAGDTADFITTLTGKQVLYPYAIPGETWTYAAASGGIVNTTGVTVKTAGAAGVRNYITRVQVINGHATVDTDVQIRDGAAGTVLWRGWAENSGGGVSANFDPPLRGTAATLVEVACGTTGSATYFNVQGFTAAE